MLCLTRKFNESILIGQDIRITVLRICVSPGGHPSVSLGITAPPEVRIDREELRLRIEAEEQAASHRQLWRSPSTPLKGA